jgi:hypothetical protein
MFSLRKFPRRFDVKFLEAELAKTFRNVNRPIFFRPGKLLNMFPLRNGNWRHCVWFIWSFANCHVQTCPPKQAWLSSSSCCYLNHDRWSNYVIPAASCPFSLLPAVSKLSCPFSLLPEASCPFSLNQKRPAHSVYWQQRPVHSVYCQQRPAPWVYGRRRDDHCLVRDN